MGWSFPLFIKEMCCLWWFQCWYYEGWKESRDITPMGGWSIFSSSCTELSNFFALLQSDWLCIYAWFKSWYSNIWWEHNKRSCSNVFGNSIKSLIPKVGKKHSLEGVFTFLQIHFLPLPLFLTFYFGFHRLVAFAIAGLHAYIYTYIYIYTHISMYISSLIRMWTVWVRRVICAHKRHYMFTHT